MVCCNKWCLILLAMHLTQYCNSAPIVDLSSESAAYFKMHNHLQPYETSAKVIFKISLPKLDATDPGECSGIDLECIADKTVYIRQMEFNHLLGGNGSGLSGVRRPKRQVVAAAVIGGFLLHSVYTVITKKMFGSDNDAEKNIRTIWQSMQGERKDFLLFRDDINLYSQNLSRALRRNWWMDSTLEKQTRAHLHLTTVNQYISRVNMGIIRCAGNLIPMELIPSAILVSKLNEVKQRVEKYDYHLTVKAENYHEYTVLIIADCIFSQSNVYVLVNVPVVRNAWTIFEMIPVPFSYQSQICVLETKHTDLIAVSKNEVRILDLNSRPFCDIVQDQLCMVPSFQRATEQSAKCASFIYNKSPIEGLGSACRFKCSHETNVTVTYLERNLISVANGKILFVDCPFNSKHVPLHSFGSVKILLKCNCSYTVDSQTVDTNGACFDDVFNDKDISIVVPHFLLAPSLSSSNFDLDGNWTEVIPILNFTRSNEINGFTETFPIFSSTLLTDQQRDVMLISLSVIVMLIVISKIVSYFLFCRIFK